MTWDPAQYERFRAERSQPFFDLLALVRHKEAMRTVDLGCGTGELTRELHTRLGCASSVGYEKSNTMLGKSTAFSSAGLTFAQADINSLDLPRKSLDLVFSNATLHWLDDHAALFARLTSWLADGGQLAVQVPANFDHPSHIIASELAREPPFERALAGYVHRTNVLSPEAYATLLDALGYREQKVRLEVYGHRLASREHVVEWVKGTLLTAYRERLNDELYASFLEKYSARLLPHLKDARPYFFPFKRILMWAAL